MGIVKKVAWFSTMKGQIGIAVTENSVGEEKGRIYIVDGFDEYEDIVSIAEYGTVFPLEQAKEICTSDCNVEY